MLLLLDFFLIFFLGLIFFEDLKNRKVRVLYFIAVFLLSMVVFFMENGIYKNLLFSLIFLTVNLLVLKLYTMIRRPGEGKYYEIPGFAEGDVLFFIVIIPVFNFYNYLLFFICGLLFSLLIHVFVKATIDKRETVPLAGYLSMLLIFVLLISRGLGFSLYNNYIF